MGKVTFGVLTTIFSLLLCLFTFTFFNCIHLYFLYDLGYEDLKYEELTYERYDIIDGYKSNVTYVIYFYEYEKPFEVSNIVLKKLDKEALSNVNKNQICEVYFKDSSSKKYDYTICEVKSNNNIILSLNNYIDANQNNQITGIIVSFILDIICIFLIVYFIKMYEMKKKYDINNKLTFGNLKIEYKIESNIIQVYNSPNICTLVINGKAVDCYVGLDSTSFCLKGKVKIFEKEVLVEAKMGYLYMKLYCDGNLVAKVFMAFG